MTMAAHVRLINHFRRANYCNASSLVSYQEIYLGNKLLTKAITQTRRVDEYLHFESRMVPNSSLSACSVLTAAETDL